jgi:putative metallohydrolase (TIGR04338 family)
MKRKRDSQRSKLYRAEEEIASFETSYPTLKEVDDYCKRVVNDKWFVKHFGLCEFGVKDGRGARAARGIGWDDLSGKRLLRITIPLWARTDRIILHELCHGLKLLDKEPGHGRVFARTYLAMVKHFMGKEAASVLRASYKHHRVKYVKTSGVKRPLSLEEKQARIARLRAYRASLQAAKRQTDTITFKTQ